MEDLISVNCLTKSVTSDFRVDQYENVYDECGVFYCTFTFLTNEEMKMVKSNPASAI